MPQFILSSAVLACAVATPCAFASDSPSTVWSGSTSSTWSTPSNWVSGTVASGGITAKFSGAIANQPNLTAAQTASVWLGTGVLGDVTISAASGTQTLTTSLAYCGGSSIKAGIWMDDSTNHNLTFGPNVNIKTSTSASSFVNLEATGTLSIQGGLILNNSPLTIGSGTSLGPVVISGAISSSGTGSLTVNTASVVTLSASNSYTGTTTATAGVLKISGLGTLGAIGSSAVTVVSGTLDLGSTSQTVASLAMTGSGGAVQNGSIGATAYTISNASGIATIGANLLANGGAGLTKSGVGTALLSGSNSYTGGTTVSGGILQAATAKAIPNAAAVNVTAGTLAVNYGGASDWTSAQVDTLWSSGTFQAGGALGFDTTNLSGTYASNVTGNLGIAKLGSNTLTLTGSNNFTGTVSAVSGTLLLGSSTALNTTPGSENTVAIGAGALMLNGYNTTVASITGTTGQIFNGVATPMTLTVGNSANLSGTFGGAIQDGAGGGALSLVKAGTGTQILTATSNGYSGSTTIGAGALQIGNGASTAFAYNNTFYLGNGSANATLQLSTSGAVTLGGVVVQGSGTNTISSNVLNTTLNATSGITLGSNATASNLAFNGAGTYFDIKTSIADPAGLSGVGGSVSVTGGYVRLYNSNSYSGPTAITGGTLAISGSGRLGGGAYAGNISNAGAFVYSSSAAQTLSGAISGAGALIQSGPATLTLSGSNSYTGNTVLAGGTTLLNSANALGSSGTISFTGGALRYSGSNTADYSGQIGASTSAITVDPNGQTIVFASPLAASNNGGLTLLGSGTLMLSATNTFSGSLTVNAGMLQAAKLGSLPTYATTGANVVGASGILAVNAGGSGEFSAGNIQTLLGNMTVTAGGLLGIDTSNAGGSFTYASPVTGNVGLLKLGAGTLILSAGSTNTGNTSINGGTVLLGGSGSATVNPLGLGTVTVNTGATLDLAGYTLGAAKSLSVFGSLTNSGAAAVYSGTVTAGQLANIGGSGDITLTAALSGSSTFNKTGADTLTISGSSSRTAGGAVLQGGVLQLNSSYAIGSNLGVTFAGGALAVGGGAAPVLGTATLNTSGTAGLGAGSTLSLWQLADGGNTLTVAGAGNLAQTGAWGNSTGAVILGPSFTGTANFNQSNVYSGGLTVKSGYAVGSSAAAAFGSGMLTIGDTSGSASATVQGDAHTFANPITVPAGSSGTLALQAAVGAAAVFSGSETLNNTLYVNSSGAGSMTLSGALSGSGSLVSNGFTTLSNNSSLTGAITVASGTLKTTGFAIAGPVSTSAGAVFDIAGNNESVGGLLGGGTVTNSGAAKILTLAGSGTYTCAGAITAATAANMALTVALGSGGVQTLSGSSSYTGATAINGGALALGPGGGLGNTVVTTGSGATFAVAQNANGASNTLAGSLTLNAGSAFSMADGYTTTMNVSGTAILAPASGASPTFTFDIAGSSADKLAITGSATVGVAGAKIVIAPSSSGITAGSYTLMTAASGLGSNVSLATAAPSYYVGTGGVYGVSLAGTGTTEIVTLTHNGLYWTGASGSAWNTAGNWNTTVAGGAVSGTAPVTTTDIAFGAANPGNLTNTLGVSTTVNSVNFLPASASVTVNPDGNTLTIGGGGITNTSANAQSINAPIVLGTSQTWTNTGSGLLTIGGAVSGSGGIAKSGAGTLTFSGLSATTANNYSGATALDGGTLAITTTNPSLSGGLVFGATAGSASASTLDLSNASATFGGGMIAQSSGTNTIVIGPGKALTTNGNVLVGSGTTAGSPKLAIAGSGGTWTVNSPGGSLQVGSTVVGSPGSSTLDLSGLGTFYADLGATGYLRVGSPGYGGTPLQTFNLAQASTIKSGTLCLGDNGPDVGLNALYLGNGAQVVNVNTITMGGANRSSGGFLFNTGTPNGTVTIRGYDGASPAVLKLWVGSANSGSLSVNSIFDVTGHNADLLFSMADVMDISNCGNAYSASFSFDTGTLTSGTFKIGARTGGGTPTTQTATVNIGGTSNYTNTASLGTVTVAQMSATAGGISGALNIAGANTTVNIASLNLGGATAVGGTATGALNIAGGTVNLTGGGITIGATAGAVNSSIALSNAVLNMQGHNIGSASASIGSFTFTSGTLQDVGTVYGPITLAGGNAHIFNSTAGSGTIAGIVSGSGQTLAKTGAGTLLVAGSNSYSGGTIVSSGSLQLGNANALGTGGLTVNGGTVDLHGNSASLAALDGAGGTVTNTVSGTATLATAVSGSSAYAGNILNGAGSVNLVKSGLSTLILSGSIGMSGLSAGEGQVTLTQSGSIGALNVYAGGTVALAANTGGTRTVLNLSALAIGGTFSGMAVPAQIAAAQLNADILGGAANTATLSAAAQSSIAPAAPEAVPEPGTLGLLLAGVFGLLGIRHKGNTRLKA